MAPPPDDWRRTGQDGYLLAAKLTCKNYQALSAEWQHDHCEFCFQKFLDPNYSPLHAEALRDPPDQHVAARDTNIEEPKRPAGKWWICEQCFAEFRDELGWTVVDSEPDAWPYHRPEPVRRPTASEYDESSPLGRPTRRWLSTRIMGARFRRSIQAVAVVMYRTEAFGN